MDPGNSIAVQADSGRHPLRFAGALLILGLGLRMAETQAASATFPRLTRVEEIKQLTPSQAGNGVPVRIRVVVTFQNDFGDCFVQDSTGGVYISRTKKSSARFQAGKIVEIEGVTAPG